MKIADIQNIYYMDHIDRVCTKFILSRVLEQEIYVLPHIQKPTPQACGEP